MATGQCCFFVGQISVQRCILTVRQYRSKYKESVESYIEEAIIRRELSDNFCFYNKNYDSIDGNLSTHLGLELIECVTCDKVLDGRLFFYFYSLYNNRSIRLGQTNT